MKKQNFLTVLLYAIGVMFILATIYELIEMFRS